MQMRGRTLTLLLITPALALGACGGGNSDSDQITSLVKKVDKDNAALCDNASKKLLAQLGGTAKCQEAARAYKDSSSIDGDITVKVDGDKATATFKTSDGKNHTVGLVKENGDWKVDSST